MSEQEDPPSEPRAAEEPREPRKPRVARHGRIGSRAEGRPEPASPVAETDDDDEPAVPAAAKAKPERVETWREMITSTYLSIDRRTLGLTRICLGWLLLCDLFRRTPDWIHMFGDTGVLPTTVILSRPQSSGFSLLHGFSENWELWALWAVMLVTYGCLFLGYRTKVAQILSLVFVTGLNGRVLLIENGGYVVHNLLLLWTCFMPLGDRFSLDAMLAELKRKREVTVTELNDRTDIIEPHRQRPFVSLVALVLVLQIAAIYYFNIIHKYGPAWSMRNAQAVHYVMYVDRMVNPLIGVTRTHIPFFVYQMMTRSVVASEFIMAFLVLWPMLPRIDWLVTRSNPDKPSFFPDFSTQKWARRLAIFVMCFLHIGFGSTFVLGPFAWALCVFSTLLFSRADWDDTVRLVRRTSRRRTILIDSTSGAAMLFGRIVMRLDRFELLGFDELDAGQKKTQAIVVERDDGTQVKGAQAMSEIVRALPVGPVFAWLVKAPVVSSIVDWAMQRGRWTRWLGLSVDKPLEQPDIVGVSALMVFEVVAALGVLLTFGFPVIPLFDDLSIVVRVIAVVLSVGLLAHLALKREPLKKRILGVRVGIREALVFAFFVGAVNQALTELWCTRKRWSDLIADINAKPFMKEHHIVLSTQPEATQVLAHKLRFLQGWFMFSPNPVMDDGTIIVDAITVDGRHVDPFWGKEPNFDLLHAKSFGYNQIWSDYFNRMHLPGNRGYRDSMVDYMRRLPERTGNPNDALASGEVYWVHDLNPKWKTTESYAEGQDLLFSFGKDGGAKDPPPPPKKPDGAS